MPSTSVRLMSGGGLSNPGLTGRTGLGSAGQFSVAAVNHEINLNSLAGVATSGVAAAVGSNVDSLNINDVLDMLPSSTSWDLFTSDTPVSVTLTNNTSYTMAGGTVSSN